MTDWKVGQMVVESKASNLVFRRLGIGNIPHHAQETRNTLNLYDR
jgi:hypothetical protein